MAEVDHHRSDTSLSGYNLGCAEEVDTEPLDDAVELGNPETENQMDTVYQDTEVCDDFDSVENLDTQLPDGYDTQVVPDSDDEGMDTSEKKGFLCRSGNFFERISGNLCEVKPHSDPLCRQQKDFNVNVDVCDYEGLVSGQAADMIVREGNDISPVIVQNSLQATELQFKDRKISELQDELANPVACHLNCADDIKQLTSQFKTRKVSIVYTRKRSRRACHLKNIDLKDEIRSPNKCNGNADLSYIASQDPEDVSKALLFVDQYVSVNAVPSSPVADVTIKDKSPPALSAKRAQNLVRWTNRRDRTGDIGIFEWDHNEEQFDSSANRGQLSSRGKQYDQAYARKSPSMRKHGNLGFNKAENFKNKEELKGLTYSDAELAVYDVKDNGDTKQAHGKKASEHSESGLDQQKNGESSLMQLDPGTIHIESENVYDVGIDTQMAAEAIQELSFAAPFGCSNVDTDESPFEMLDESLRCSEKRSHVQPWCFPKKARSASRGIVNHPPKRMGIPCSDDQENIMQTSEVEVWTIMGRCITNGSIIEDSGKDKRAKKSDTNGGEGVIMDGLKENLNSLVSDEHMPLCKLKRRRKHRNPLAEDLDPSNLLYVNEGLMNASTGRELDNMETSPDDKRKEMCAIDIISESEPSDQVKSQTKFLHNKSRNTRNMKGTEGEKTCLVVDNSINYRFVGGQNEQIEIGFHAKDKVRGRSANILEASSMMENCPQIPCRKPSDIGNRDSSQEDMSPVIGRPKYLYWRDYPRGKRACWSVTGRSEVLSHLEKLPLKLTKGDTHVCSSRNQFKSDSCFNSSFFGFNMKKKRRSSVYVSPCWSSSQRHFNGSLLRQCVDETRQIAVVHADDSVTKKRDTSGHLTDTSTTVHFDKADYMGYVPTMHETRKDDTRLGSSEALKSHDLNLVASPKCPLIINEMHFTNAIDGYCEQLDKKKVAMSPLTRELVRLGFNKSMPEFTSKDSRRRKTMAKIRVLLSQHLDQGTSKQQKKILTRFGVSMASCPSDATHFVADKFARTRNMLECIAQGKPVVTHLWLESCDQAGSYIDERNYVLRDVKKELELGFSLSCSLDQARQHPLLKGYRVFITPNTQPKREMLASLVNASHGQAVDVPIDSATMDNMDLDDMLILSCEEDETCCAPFLQRGKSAYSPELLLHGIIIQKLEFKRHQLFTDYVKE